MSKPFYITTAIHYVNDLPHIGHIYENIVADVIARFHRMKGDDVFFLTGTDEHGQKIERSAAKQGISPIELADRVVAAHRAHWTRLEITNDDFIRTTEDRHRIGVYELIRRIQEQSPGDIYLGEHAGWYCQSEETFIPESQVANGKCEEGHPVEWTSEKNYFFKLSAYRDRLMKYYREHPDFVQPQTRFNEVTSFVDAGLRDLSISRTSITWGIPFPGAPNHVIYVWMDALTNYISALGFGSDDDSRYQRWWPADIHLVGKDIVRFHAVYWPAFLMAAGLELPKSIVGHGWWLRDNQKISKSTGNIVRPDDIIERFGSDAFRYFVMREMTFGQDANYSDESFLQRYNSDLANDLGNTLSRILKMSASYFDGKTPPIPCDDNDLQKNAERLIPEYFREMERLNFQRALEVIWRALVGVNGYIVSHEPWKHYKEKGADESLSRIIWNTLESMRLVWLMVSPFMPSLSATALARIGAAGESLRTESLVWGRLPNNRPIEAGDALFPRVDTAEYLAGAPTPAAKGAPMTEEKKPAETPNPPVTPDVTSAPQQAGPPPQTTEAIAPDTSRISIDEFMKTDLRVAQVLEAERVPKSKKLIRMRITTGDEERTIVAGIATKYEPEELVGRKVVIVANLQPAKLMGIESNGMVLAASIDGEPSLLSVDPSVPNGTKVR
ncbi:MAG: methionine--tRNA ligase [Thermoanaerobaculia bacterium]